VLKFIVGYLQYSRVILRHVQESLNGALAFAAVVNNVGVNICAGVSRTAMTN